MADYDLLVIGAGSGGLAAAERAAAYGAQVAIVEQFKPGGACVNYGCIPEKLLDFAASFNRLEQVAASYGWKECQREFNWEHFINAKEQQIHHLNDLHLHHLQEAGVTLVQGHASFHDAQTLMVDDKPITAEKILIAVGAKPVKAAIPGIEHAITWHELYHLPAQPKSVAIIGGDPIGVKIAGSLNDLGSQVTQIVTESCILSQLDTEFSQEIQKQLINQGIKVLANTQVEKIEKPESSFCLTFSEQASPLAVKTVLMDATRKPNLEHLNLSKVSIQLTNSGAIRIDEFSRTTHPNIFAVGDCTDRIPLTPSAIAQGRAFAETAFGGHPQTANLDWVPISVASHPEAATVGLSEAQARAKFGDAIHCYRTRFRPLFYCLIGWDRKTWIKLVVNQQDSERVLGIHMIGDGAVEIIQSLAVALRLGATKKDLDAAIGIHPSSAEEIFSM